MGISVFFVDPYALVAIGYHVAYSFCETSVKVHA
jgi:hypothetical protein